MPCSLAGCYEEGRRRATQGPLACEHGLLLISCCPVRDAWIRVLASVQTLTVCGLVQGREGFK